MSTSTSASPTLLFFFLLLLARPPPSNSFSYFQYRIVFSLAHSLMMRVATLRASRGDHSGADRARSIAKMIGKVGGHGLWRQMWSISWGYMKNYSWEDMSPSEMFGAIKDVNELLRFVRELTQIESDLERSTWTKRNYNQVLRVCDSLFSRLLSVVQSGPLRELVETVQKEVVDGGLLWDCLEVGRGDLKGLMQIIKNVAEQFSSSYADL